MHTVSRNCTVDSMRKVLDPLYTISWKHNSLDVCEHLCGRTCHDCCAEYDLIVERAVVMAATPMAALACCPAYLSLVKFHQLTELLCRPRACWVAVLSTRCSVTVSVEAMAWRGAVAPMGDSTGCRRGAHAARRALVREPRWITLSSHRASIMSKAAHEAGLSTPW